MHKILFLGQKEIGQKCFDHLLEKKNHFSICGCITNSSSDTWWGENKIWKSALNHEIQSLDNSKRNTKAILDLILKNNVRTIFSVQHPWLLPKEILEAVKGQCFNIHNAPLPYYQGHNVCNHAILNNETSFCSTLHWMVEKVDAGAIIKEEWFSIDTNETALSLYKKGNAAAEKLFLFLLDSLINYNPLPKTELSGKPRFYPRSSIKNLNFIDDFSSFEQSDRKARAFYFPPFEPAYQIKNNKKVYIFPKEVEPYIIES